MTTHPRTFLPLILLVAGLCLAADVNQVTGSDTPPVGASSGPPPETDQPIDGAKVPNGLVVMHLGDRLMQLLTAPSPSPAVPEVDPIQLAKALKGYGLGLRAVRVDVVPGESLLVTAGPAAAFPGDELLQLSAGESRAVSEVVFVVLTRRQAVRDGLPVVVVESP